MRPKQESTPVQKNTDETKPTGGESTDAPAKLWPEWRSSGHILVADDDEAIRTVIQRALITIGFTVRTAPGGREALSLFEKESGKFVLVILDLRMPGTDPAQVVRGLRELRPDVRILLMSGFNRQKALQLTQALELTGFLPKPFTLEELASKVRLMTQA
jgi:CheY-like chemotaxis protein